MATGAVVTSIANLPTVVLEDIAILCSPATAAIARQVCHLWRSAFSWPATLRLYSQRPGSEAAQLVGGATPPYSRATCAKLVLATSPAACSQVQLDAWLDALRQRTAITRLTLTSANTTPLIHTDAFLLPPCDLLTPLSLAGLATLQHLRSLVVGPTMTQAGLEAAAAVVHHLTLLTRLRFTAPCSSLATAALAASLSSGMPHLAVLKLCPNSEASTMQSPVTEAGLLSLLTAAAAGAPRLRVLVCRIVSHQLRTWRAIELAFGPAALLPMRVLVRADPSACTSSFLRIWKAAGHSGKTMSLKATIDAPDKPDPSDGAACLLCTRGLAAAWEELQRHGEHQPQPALESLSLTLNRHPFSAPTLDLCALPATMHRLILYLGQGPAAWPLVSGAAPQLTSLQLSMEPGKVQPLPLAVLAAACPRLARLTVTCDMRSGDGSTWGALNHLTRLTRLIVSGNREGQPSSHSLKVIPTACLAPSLVELHLCDMRVPAAAQAPCLGKLRTLLLNQCFVEDFRVFSGADSVRRLQTWDVAVGTGAEALMHFQELEHLHDRARRLPEGLWTVASFAALAARAAAAAAGDGAAAAAPLLPRLRRLRISSPGGPTSRPCCPESLMAEVPLQEIHLDVRSQVALQGLPEEALEAWLRPLGSLRSLAVCEVSGVNSAEYAPLLQALLPLVVVEAVAS